MSPCRATTSHLSFHARAVLLINAQILYVVRTLMNCVCSFNPLAHSTSIRLFIEWVLIHKLRIVSVSRGPLRSSITYYKTSLMTGKPVYDGTRASLAKKAPRVGL